jgi:hypothetical protein
MISIGKYKICLSKYPRKTQLKSNLYKLANCKDRKNQIEKFMKTHSIFWSITTLLTMIFYSIIYLFTSFYSPIIHNILPLTLKHLIFEQEITIYSEA